MNIFLGILALYLHVKFQLDENSASSIYHLHEFFGCFFAIAGAIIADCWLGHFKSIMLIGFMFSVGAGIVSTGNVGIAGFSLL